jgi:hypothetical protein
MHPGGGREVRSDGRKPEVVFENDLGWVVGEERIDIYGNIG